MFKRFLVLGVLLVGLMFVASSSSITEAAPQVKAPECGTCDTDNDCNEGEACRSAGCSNGKKRCVSAN